MKSTLPAHRVLAASTEGASWLQVVQVGAQNHRATVCPRNWVKSTVPPPTSGAVNCNDWGTPSFTEPSFTDPAMLPPSGDVPPDGAALRSLPQPASSSPTAQRARIERRIAGTIPP